MTDAAPTPNSGADPVLDALDAAMSEPGSSQPELTVQSAVDIAEGDPLVVLRFNGETVQVAPDVARGMSVQFATAAARSESEAAFVKLLRSRGEESTDTIRTNLADLYGRY